MAEKTQYVVLRSEDGTTWSEHKEVEAGNSEQAVRLGTKAEDGDHHEDGHYRAVPKRNWGSEEDIIVIANETKVVSSFSKKAPAAAPARPRRQRKPPTPAPAAEEPKAEDEQGEKQQELAGAAA